MMLAILLALAGRRYGYGEDVRLFYLSPEVARVAGLVCTGAAALVGSPVPDFAIGVGARWWP